MTAVRQEVSGGGRIPAAGCSDVYLVPACASAHDKGSVKDFCVGVVAEVEEFSRGLRQAYSAKVPKKRKTEKMKMCKKQVLLSFDELLTALINVLQKVDGN